MIWENELRSFSFPSSPSDFLGENLLFVRFPRIFIWPWLCDSFQGLKKDLFSPKTDIDNF